MMSKQIPLTKGFCAIVDDEDFTLVSQYRWCINSGGYATRVVNKKAILMHRIINNTPPDLETDHINGNRLDNRRCNLRTATHLDNSSNRKPHTDSTSKYKGVFLNPVNKTWRAVIMVNGKREYLGTFKNELEAAKAYDLAAFEKQGSFARLNLIGVTSV